MSGVSSPAATDNRTARYAPSVQHDVRNLSPPEAFDGATFLYVSGDPQSVNPQRARVAFGVGLTTFLLVGVAATELAATAVEFSVFVGIPAGLLAGALAAVSTYRRLGGDAGERFRRAAAAAAVFGYAVLVLALVRYVLAPARGLLTLDVIAGLALLAAAAAYLVGPVD